MPIKIIVPLERTERLREPANRKGTLSLRCRWPFSAWAMVGFFFLFCQGANADWPQINGPNRNGVAVNESLLTRWPENGLKTIWTHEVGDGNAGPVVVGDMLIVFHRPGKKYRVDALNCQTGEPIWKTDLEADYNGGMDGDRGPKCVPLVHEERVFLYGAGGILFCLDLGTGDLIWKKNLRKTFRSRDGFFGVGATPIVVGNRLIVNAGGREASLVALDPASGDLEWKSFADDASYSSPIEIEIGGRPIAVFVTRLNLIGVDPQDGKVVFQTQFGKSGSTVNAAMPVAAKLDGKSHLFVTAAYGVGSRWFKIDPEGLETVWSNDTSLSSQYSTPVYYRDQLFGTAGREDYQNGSFRCIDAKNGNVLWKRDSFPVGHSILVNDRILVLDFKGGFHVIQANADKFVQDYQTKLFNEPARSMPALSNGFFYARSNSGRNQTAKLICVEVGQHP